MRVLRRDRYRRFLMARADSRFAYVWLSRWKAIRDGRPQMREGGDDAYRPWGSRHAYPWPLEPIPGYWQRGLGDRYQACDTGRGFYRGKYCLYSPP